MRRRSVLAAAAACPAGPALGASRWMSPSCWPPMPWGSIDDDEFCLQKEGIVEAIADPPVLAAIASQPIGRSTFAYLAWGSPGAPRVIVPWTVVAGAADAARFGEAVLRAPRSLQSWNAIGARSWCRPTFCPTAHSKRRAV